MDDLLKKTAVIAVIAAGIYLALFLFFDQEIDLWVHSTVSNTWIFRLGIAISTLATGAYIKLAIAACIILVVVIDPVCKDAGRKTFSLSASAAPWR